MPRSRSPRASLSTAALSFDEWLMNTRMLVQLILVEGPLVMAIAIK